MLQRHIGRLNNFPGILVMCIFQVSYRMDIAIIGGGLSGTLLAHYLLEADQLAGAIYLFEKDETQLSRGIAYRATNQAQLLNVAAENMNIPGLPVGNFYQWLLKNDHTDFAPGDFVPRALFGNYLKEIFHKSLNQTSQVKIKVLNDEVIDIVKDENAVDVITANGKSYRVEKAIIANGIIAPADPFFVSDEIKATGRYQSNPWHHGYHDLLKKNDHVTLIGTGLTMLDHAIGLLTSDKNLSVTVFSRRGLLPLPHKTYQSYSFPEYSITPTEDIGELLASIRAYYHAHKNNGLDWRNLIDRIRHEVPQLWKTLNRVSKKRFIRHLKPYWEIHRHRAPEKILNIVKKAQQHGRFTVLKGRIQKVIVNNRQLQLELTSTTRNTTIETNYLLNSSGLQQNISLTSDSLLKKLFERGYMIADSNNLGIETDETGALACNHGEKNIYAIGALRRAAVFECTAAKEIGEHAFQLSKDLMKPLSV